VAVISGRPLAYLQLHLGGATGTELVGLYGLERARSGGIEAEEVAAAEPWRATLEAAATAAEAQAPDGVVVERKGLAVTLHFRAVPERAAWVERFAAGEVAARGLAAHPGKMSVELRPPVRTDKGTVIGELGADLEAVCFIGDDRGDLPGFEELRRLRSEGKSTLAVAVAGPETPVELLDSADLVVDGPAGVIALLEALAAGEPRTP
jgi:trehalose 6-phosphate phosphatase